MNVICTFKLVVFVFDVSFSLMTCLVHIINLLKMQFSVKDLQIIVDLLTFNREILNQKLHLLWTFIFCAVNAIYIMCSSEYKYFTPFISLNVRPIRNCHLNYLNWKWIDWFLCDRNITYKYNVIKVP